MNIEDIFLMFTNRISDPFVGPILVNFNIPAI